LTIMNFHSVLIDLDGTLLDTIPDLASAVNSMLAEFGMSALPVETVATYVGKGTENLVKRVLNDPRVALPADASAVAAALEVFNRHYHACNGRESKLYDGVLEGLRAFRLDGARL